MKRLSIKGIDHYAYSRDEFVSADISIKSRNSNDVHIIAEIVDTEPYLVLFFVETKIEPSDINNLSYKELYDKYIGILCDKAQKDPMYRGYEIVLQ